MLTDSDFEQAALELRNGGLVAFPTETVYGLGANALDPTAVAKIFELKGRPRFDPLIVHIAAPDAISDFVQNVPVAANKLIETFWPGPLSLVLPKQVCIPDIVTSGLGTVAIRCPSHPVARRLIQQAGIPVAAPSANKFCAVSPTTAEHVREQFGDRLSLILDGGPAEVGVESTVVSFSGETATLLRPGGITVEQLAQTLGAIGQQEPGTATPTSPGQLPVHYAPTTPLQLTDAPPTANERSGVLALTHPDDAASFAAVEVLSESGSLREAAANLFAAMRRLDKMNLDRIIARPIPETGLGHAIMDRLKRAAAKS